MRNLPCQKICISDKKLGIFEMKLKWRKKKQFEVFGKWDYTNHRAEWLQQEAKRE